MTNKTSNQCKCIGAKCQLHTEWINVNQQIHSHNSSGRNKFEAFRFHKKLEMSCQKWGKKFLKKPDSYLQTTENNVAISKINHFNIMISKEDAPRSWGWNDIKAGVGIILAIEKAIISSWNKIFISLVEPCQNRSMKRLNT